MADRYDAAIDAALGGGDKYDQAIDAALSTEQPFSGSWNALTTKNLENAPFYDPLAQAARLGQFANRGNQELAGGIAELTGRVGSALERSGMERAGQFVTEKGVGIAGALGTASEFLLPQNRLGVASYAVAPLMKAYQAMRAPIPGTTKPIQKPGVVAQLGQARTKVRGEDIQQAINDPSVFQAPTVKAANEAYGAAAGPLKGAARSLRDQTGKVLLGEADWSEAINRPGRILAGTELDASGKVVSMDPQTALEGVQSINRFTRNKANTAKLDKEQFGELLKLKDQLITFLERNGTPGMRAAATVLRKAHVKENLSTILPQNKFGGNDALRGMEAGAELSAAAALALSGNPLAAIPPALYGLTASPALLGGAIRNYHSVTNPQTMGAAAAAVNAYQNAPEGSVAEYYRRQQSQAR